ncbi:MAG: Stp1/IreP family PP2C-type Ser/Thr phosphatase [Chloroflexi bacterium]|nr:Stp1/IreP family PP2C-type Ser/Thr phosphatase [Chloroflexota bacterium]
MSDRATTTVTRLSVGSCTDVGAVRTRNEDSLLVEPLESPEAQAYGWLGIVADGLGGHRRGDLASQLAVQTTRQTFYQRPRGRSTGDRLRAAVERANTDIRRTGDESPATTEMASTITAAVIEATHLTVAQVGDSRGYLIRNSRLRQITHDHSLVDELVRSGELTPEQAAHHPNRNVITRALGTRTTVDVDIFEEGLHDDDVVVLCSDGLYRCVEESEIARSLVSEPQAAAESLVALANHRGAPDNVSVIIIRISVVV